MKKIFLWLLLFLAVFGITVFLIKYLSRSAANIISPLGLKDRPLDVFTIDNLGKRVYQPSQIILDNPVSTTSAFVSYLFHFDSDGKKVTGLINIPETPKSTKIPAIVQLRGYVDPSIYEPGVGTKRSGEVYAANGFITIAPDFLGYGGSDNPSTDIFAERFETYTTVLNLLASLKTLPIIDTGHIFLWGHSNGGHIGLTTLTIYSEATKSSQMPAVVAATFWAPVTRPFPYSILYYTDEQADMGKSLRKELAKFEENYNTDLYAFTNYLGRISVPMQIHQGTSDDAVPYKWSDEIVGKMGKNGVKVDYFLYPGADHNLQGSWNTVVERDLNFFRKYLSP